MLTFIQGFCVGAATVIIPFIVYLKLWCIREANIKERKKAIKRERRIEAARAEENKMRIEELFRQVSEVSGRDNV